MAQYPYAKAPSQLKENANPLKDLENTALSNKAVFFPSDLADIDHWVSFYIVNRRYGTRSAETEIQDSHSVIRLPLPGNLSTGYRAGYDEMNMLGLNELVAKTAANWDTVSSTAGNIYSIAKNDGFLAAAKEAYKSADNNSVLETGGAALVRGFIKSAADSDTGRSAQLGIGMAINPHKAVLFNGIGFRDHNFNYRFSPRNREETENLRTIISKFKTAMLPKYGQHKIWFEYPYEFIIKFHYENYLFRLEKSVLESFSINYHGQGVPAYFSAIPGAPVDVEISMSFKETAIITREDAEAGY